MANDFLDNFNISNDENLDDILPFHDKPLVDFDKNSSVGNTEDKDKGVSSPGKPTPKRLSKNACSGDKVTLADSHIYLPVTLQDVLRHLCIIHHVSLSKLFVDSAWQVYGPEIKKRYPDMYEQVKESLSR